MEEQEREFIFYEYNHIIRRVGRQNSRQNQKEKQKEKQKSERELGTSRWELKSDKHIKAFDRQRTVCDMTQSSVSGARVDDYNIPCKWVALELKKKFAREFVSKRDGN